MATNAADFWLAFQCKSTNPASGDYCRYPDGPFRWVNDGRGGAWTGVFAEEPWHTGIGMQGMIRYHRATSNSDIGTVITNWAAGLLNNTQPNRTGLSGLYQLTVPSSFAGVDCHRYFYTQLGGTTTALTADKDQGYGCSGGAESVYGARDISYEIISTFGYMYRRTSTASYQSRGDDMFAYSYNWQDGYGGQWAWSGVTNGPKSHGQALCCNDSYQVDRLGSTAASITPVATSISVKFSLAGVTNATKVRMTATLPNGTTTSATCTSSPCTVSGLDSVQGTKASLRLEYLSSGDAVLAAGDQQSVPVV